MRHTGWRAVAIEAAAVLFLQLAVPVHAQSNPQESYHYACALDDAYIYEDADSGSEKLASLQEGAVCRVMADENGYSRVFSGGYTGYVETSLLDSSEETMGEVSSCEGIAVETDTCVYEEPDEDSHIIAERRHGATEYFADDVAQPEEWDSDGWTKVYIFTGGEAEEGWMKNVDIVPARIVPDAEPYIEADGFLIATSSEIRIIEAASLRSRAKELSQEVLAEKKSKKQYNVQKGVLNSYVGTVIGPSNCKETYYNLPMSGVVKIMRRMGYSEEEYPYWVREDGAKMLGDYIMCAADFNLRPRGSLVESSLGTCIVADTGDFIYTNPTQIDIAVDW